VKQYPILVIWSYEDEEYVSVVPDLRGCSASGATVAVAAKEANTAKRLWLEVARDEGYPLPAPPARLSLCAAAAP